MLLKLIAIQEAIIVIDKTYEIASVLNQNKLNLAGYNLEWYKYGHPILNGVVIVQLEEPLQVLYHRL